MRRLARVRVLHYAQVMLSSDLLDGYNRFRSGAYAQQRARYDELAHGQSPATMIVSCADSRVDPATIFDAAPGELFVVRNVANIVPPYEEGGGYHGVSSAIEFAVLGLKVSEIVIMGHGACGGIAAALHGHGLLPPETSFITRWMEIIAPARDRVARAAAADPGLDAQHTLELDAIRVSLANLRGFPFVGEAERSGQLRLSGAHFSVASGTLEVLDGEGFRAA